MRNIWIYLILVLVAVSSCEVPPENPFFAEYDTPYEVPPFDKIENKHFMPAIEKGIEEQEAEIKEIVENPDPPTFENTIEALEYSGDLLSRVSSVFFNYNSHNISDEIEELAREISPKLSAHRDNIYLDIDLFERVDDVYNQKDELDLNSEQKRLLEQTHKTFIRNGAGLEEEKRERFREINEKLSSLTLEFGQNVQAETNKFELLIEDEEDLSGLPSSQIEAAAEEAKERGYDEGWVFTLHNPSVKPFLTYADNRAKRMEIKHAYIMRGDNNNEYDNKENIRQIVDLRLERANMLGYDNHAQYVLEENMTEKPETVNDFLDELWEASLPIAKQEAEDLQDLIYREGKEFDLEPWDWRYYAEKLRKEKFDLDEEEIRPYFSLNNVRDGIFTITEKLWGITFEELNDMPVYHEEATAYEVFDHDGSHLGILYMDFHPRESKRGGAWMSSYRTQHVDEEGNFVNPVITINCNFSRPSGGKPSLLTFRETETFFHEFGHALHGLLSDVTYRSLAGTSVPRDFVELPSQIMENWVNEPEVMKMFAKHYDTGEPIPEDLTDRMEQSAHFNQGFQTVEYLAASYLDMDYHTISEKKDIDIHEFEQECIERINLIPEIVFRYRSTYFNHIFAGGYSAGYYSYIWSGLLDADAYEAFVETGDFFHQPTAESFRTNILERGGTKDAMDMYIDFRGREPEIEPLLRQRGLIQE